MIERFKNIFTGLERAHGVTIVEDTNGNGTKVKGKSFVKRQSVTDELWQKHLVCVEFQLQFLLIKMEKSLQELWAQQTLMIKYL